MAQNFQQRARRRKLLYFAVIIVLSFVMLGARQFVERQAYQNDLQEIDLGNVDLGGSMARYALVSFRGPLLCGLWWEACERQARHDWSQMRLLIQTITKLQPHFKEPWIYLSWNLAYNVSVEFDRIEDKYFFIAEGSQLLVDGEKQNRAKVFDPDIGGKREVPDPEICFSMAFYQQQKVNVSDEAAYFRILMQLSCIHPDKWDPETLRQDPRRFAEFKTAYPRLVARIRELRRIPIGAEDRLNREILAFFEAYRTIPSLYSGTQETKPAVEGRQGLELTTTRFPHWAEGRAPANPELEPVQDIYDVSRSWYERGNEALPPPISTAGEPMGLPREERRFRLPRRMFSLLYRSWPAKARSIQAGNLEKEGWFKDARLVWEDAWQRWKRFGQQNGVDIEPDEMRALQQRTTLYRERFPQLAQVGLPPPAARVAEEPQLQKSFEAFQQLLWHSRHRGTTNYDHHEPHADVHRKEGASKAGEHIFTAEHRYRADLDAARREYEAGLELWKGFLAEPRTDFLLALGPTWGWGAAVMQPHELFSRTTFGSNRQSQEDLGESHARYLRVRARLEAPWMTLALVFRDRMQLFMHSIDSPAGSLAGLRAMPDNLMPREVEMVENVLSTRIGPLEGFLLPDITQKYSWGYEQKPQIPELPGKPPLPARVQPPTVTPIK